MKHHAYYCSWALLVGTLVCTEGAQAQTAASTSGLVSGIAYHLVDLNLSDGITPSITFSPVAGSTGDASEFYIRTMYAHTYEPDLTQAASPLFGTGSGSLSNAQGNQTVSKSGNNVATSASASVSDLTNPANLTVSTSTGGLMYYATASLFTNGVNFQLSPNTKLVIDGTVNLQAAADASLLNGSTAAQLLTSPDKGLYLNSNSSVSLSLFGSGGSVGYANYSQTAYAGSVIGKDPGYSSGGYLVPLLRISS